MFEVNPIIISNLTDQFLEERKKNSDNLNKIAEKAKNGCVHSQELLLAKIERLMEKYILKYLSNKDYFEDCLQQCRFHLLKTLCQYDVSKPFIPWMAIVVRNCTLNFIRTQNKWRFSSFNVSEDEDEELLPKSEEITAYEILEKDERCSLLHSALSKLKKVYQRVIKHYYFENLSCEEISKIERAPVGTVKNRLFKARNVLRKQLAGYVN